jgi:O-antigen/teichoic acid export membrane protein
MLPRDRSEGTAVDSIVRNSTILAGAKVISSAIGLAVVALLPRILGNAEFGRLYLAIAVAGIFGTIANFGLSQVVTREVARDRARTRDVLRRAVTLTLGLGGCLYLTLPSIVAALGYSPYVGHLVLILGLGMLIDAWAQVLASIFQAHERMLVPAVARVAANVATLLVLLSFRNLGSALVVAIVMVTANLLLLVIHAAPLSRLEGFQQASAPSTALSWRRLLVAGLPFLAWQALGLIYFRIGVIMLGRMTTDATVGWYGAAGRLLDGFTFIPDTLMMATFPVVARLWTSSPSEFLVASRKTLDLLLVVTVPLVVTIFVLAHDIVAFLFTVPEFAPTVPILRINALTLGFIFVDYYLATILIAVGRERQWLAISVGACVLNPALSWALITHTHRYYGNGGIGAALATLATEVFVLFYALHLLPSGTFSRASTRVALRAATAGGVSAGGLGLGLLLGLPWIAVALGALLIYAAIVLWLGLVPDEILRSARRLLAWGPASAEVV